MLNGRGLGLVGLVMYSMSKCITNIYTVHYIDIAVCRFGHAGFNMVSFSFSSTCLSSMHVDESQPSSDDVVPCHKELHMIRKSINLIGLAPLGS